MEESHHALFCRFAIATLEIVSTSADFGLILNSGLEVGKTSLKKMPIGKY